MVGYIPFFNSHDPQYPFKGMKKLAEKYGPVTAFYLGPSKPFISICGFEAVQEALRNTDLDGRPDSVPLRARTCNERLGISIFFFYRNIHGLCNLSLLIIPSFILTME